MATITLRPSATGPRYRAMVRMRGESHVQTFPTKGEATRWAASLERDILDRIAGKLPKKTLLEALRRYAAEVSPTKKGERWEVVRLKTFEAVPFIRKVISEVTAMDLNGWKAKRLAVVSGPSVRRELTLWSSVFETARKEWGWMKFNPCVDVKKPRDRPHRTRVYAQSEIDAILDKLGWVEAEPTTSAQYTALAWLACLENGFRASEVLGVSKATFSKTRRVLSLPDSKNGDPREIALMPRTVALFSLLPQGFFPITSDVLDVKFREARDAAGIDDATFHDSRHTAATRIARFVRDGKLSVFEFCRIFGWKDINQALTYVNDTADDIAMRLSALSQGSALART